MLNFAPKALSFIIKLRRYLKEYKVIITVYSKRLNLLRRNMLDRNSSELIAKVFLDSSVIEVHYIYNIHFIQSRPRVALFPSPSANKWPCWKRLKNSANNRPVQSLTMPRSVPEWIFFYSRWIGIKLLQFFYDISLSRTSSNRTYGYET